VPAAQRGHAIEVPARCGRLGDPAARRRRAAKAAAPQRHPGQAAAHDAKTAELADYKLGRITRDDEDGYHRI